MMFKPTLAAAVLALLAAGLEPERPASGLKEERMTLVYSATAQQGSIVIEAESEASLDFVEVRSPSGAHVLAMRTQPALGFALSGFVLETGKSDAETLYATFTAGRYSLRARTVTGQHLEGMAVLSHELPQPATIASPLQDALVAHDAVVVTWNGDPLAVGYRVMLEQGESDGLAVELSASANSFLVPAGVLAPGLSTHLEVGTIGPNGNCTLVELDFTTR